MPRRTGKGGSLASYFYNESVGDGIDAVAQTKPVVEKTKASSSSFLPEKTQKLKGWFNGQWMGPGPEPTRPKHHAPKSFKNKKGYKEIMMHMKNSLGVMKEHFKATETIYEEHSAWPLHPIYMKIQDCIEKCKQEIRNTRTHTGTGRHRRNVEAVHAKRIDTSGWGLKGIHDAITSYVYQAKTNHLKLERPHHHADGTHLYVNVVLAWLFAAKRQIMSNLSVYIEQAFNKTPAMTKFLEHEHKGREAFAAFRGYKKDLPPRKRKSYTLEDANLLAEQHAALYD